MPIDARKTTMKNRWRWWAVLGLVLAFLSLVAAHIIARRRWEARVAAFCYSAPELARKNPIVLSNAQWKLKQWTSGLPLGDLHGYPEPDAILIRGHSVTFIWIPPILAWVPEPTRTGSEAYGLEFVFAPDGTVTARCQHGSD
jgi:hypothetical protein